MITIIRILIAITIVTVTVGSGRVHRAIKFSQTAAEVRVIREPTYADWLDSKP